MDTSSKLPPLRALNPDSLPAEPSQDSGVLPSQKIRFDQDVETWKHTKGYLDYMLFLRRLNEAVTGVKLPWEGSKPSEHITAIIHLLDELDGWIDDIPPQPTPQRFGNLAFRTWGRRLEERIPSLLHDLLPDSHRRAIPFLTPYLTTSFGSFVRMDYGTGHETSFALFLLCLTLTRFLQPDPVEERHIVLTLFLRYLRLCWRLQDVYRLEPAGSHGVWGLDDSHFLPFIFGSAQLKGSDIPVNAVLRASLPPSNLYFMSIMRILEVKKGPFHEHSSQLYAIATGVPYWGKVNSGLFKMYEAEVLGKRVVVQHLPLGGLLEWDPPASYAQKDTSGSSTAGRLDSSLYPNPRVTTSRTTSHPTSMGLDASQHSIGSLSRTRSSATASMQNPRATARPLDEHSSDIRHPLV